MKELQKTKKVISRTVFGVALTTLCLTNGCKEQIKEETAKIIPVKVVDIGLSDHLNSQNYVGTVEESSAISVGFSGSGTIERILVSEGERVRKGQLLAVLNTHTAQNAYDVAKSTLHQAKDAYDRLKPLHEKGSLTDIKWVEVETGFEKAKAMEAIAKKNLEDCNLYAPISGVIAKRSAEEGGNVMPSTSVFKLVSIDEVYINVPISENEIGSIKVGQTATISVPALDNRNYTGVVDIKGVEANPVSRTYAIKIKVSNPKSELMPGMVCKAFLQNAKDGNTQKIVVPNRTVQVSHDGKHFVWIAENGIAKRRFVTIGTLNCNGVIVESGLSDGEQLIVEGYQKVSENMQITILN